MRRIIPVLALFLLPSLLASQEQTKEPGPLTFDLKGYYRNLLSWQRTEGMQGADLTPLPTQSVMDMKRLRLSPKVYWKDSVTLLADINTEVYTGSYTGRREFDLMWRENSFNRPLGGDALYYRDDTVALRNSIHRVYLKIDTPMASVTAGRQQVRFGSGRLWNPLDILNPLSPTAMEGAEEQPGVDALRVDIYPAEMSELSLVYVPWLRNDTFSDTKLSDGSFLGRYRQTLGNIDIALLGGRLTERYTAGADGALILFDGMARSSAVFFFPDDDEPYVVAAGGYEYAFPKGTDITFEYLYNGGAVNRNNTLSAAWGGYLYDGMNQQRFQSLNQRLLTLNRHYLSLALSQDITPLLSADLFLIADIEGEGIFAAPGVRYSVSDNITASAGVLWGTGNDSGSGRSDFSDYRNHPLVHGMLTLYF